jgi:hypothetical protein
MNQSSRVNTLLMQAVRESDLPFRKKFLVRMALLSPKVQEYVYEYLVGSLIEGARISSEPELAAIGDGELLRLIIENLPEIIAAIIKLIGLFG